MSDHPPIVAETLMVHGHFTGDELTTLIDHWAKLDQRLQSFRDRSVAMNLYIHDRDHAAQHVVLDVTIGGFNPFVARAADGDLDRALNAVRDEMIRQLTDAKNKTEPRNNRKLRATERSAKH